MTENLTKDEVREAMLKKATADMDLAEEANEAIKAALEDMTSPEGRVLLASYLAEHLGRLDRKLQEMDVDRSKLPGSKCHWAGREMLRDESPRRLTNGVMGLLTKTSEKRAPHHVLTFDSVDPEWEERTVVVLSPSVVEKLDGYRVEVWEGEEGDRAVLVESGG